MFERTKKISLFDLRDKLLHRANLLYSDMKNKFEELEEQKYEKEKENAISLLNKTEEELKKKLEIEKTNENKGVKDYEKTADLLYTTMKNKEENNINQINKMRNNISKYTLKELGLNDKEYEIKGDIISSKKIKKEHEIINNVKFSTETNNKKIENLKILAKENRSQRLKEDNTEYLKKHAFKEQIGVDNIDNKIIRNIEKKL